MSDPFDVGDEQIVFAAGTYGTNQQSADIFTAGARYLRAYLNVSAVGPGSVTLAINARDAASGQSVNLLTSVAISATGLYVFRIGPGLAPSPGSVANDVVPRHVNFGVTANSGNVTYSLGYELGV